MVTDREAILEVDQISFAYPNGEAVLHELSLALQPGERTLLFGENGAGKSTLMFNLLGIYQPITGCIYFQGEKISDLPEEVLRQKMGYIFQNPDDQVFAPTVKEDILFGLIQFGYSPEERAGRLAQVVELLQIEHLLKRNPRHLSYGEKRRVALAGVLVLEPEIIFFDEPLAFLDPLGRKLFMGIMDQLALQGKTLLVITHDLNFAAEWGERYLVLQEGQIVADGSRQVLQDGVGCFGGERPIVAQIFAEMLPPERLPVRIEEGQEMIRELLEQNALLDGVQ